MSLRVIINDGVVNLTLKPVQFYRTCHDRYTNNRVLRYAAHNHQQNSSFQRNIGAIFFKIDLIFCDTLQKTTAFAIVYSLSVNNNLFQLL
jgi:hypothetical protein